MYSKLAVTTEHARRSRYNNHAIALGDSRGPVVAGTIQIILVPDHRKYCVLQVVPASPRFTVGEEESKAGVDAPVVPAPMQETAHAAHLRRQLGVALSNVKPVDLMRCEAVSFDSELGRGACGWVEGRGPEKGVGQPELRMCLKRSAVLARRTPGRITDIAG